MWSGYKTENKRGETRNRESAQKEENFVDSSHKARKSHARKFLVQFLGAPVVFLLFSLSFCVRLPTTIALCIYLFILSI
jgi:hypothetical protein